eukprot:7802938-Heterocapsa_arctica.AAC.1
MLTYQPGPQRVVFFAIQDLGAKGRLKHVTYPCHSILGKVVNSSCVSQAINRTMQPRESFSQS